MRALLLFLLTLPLAAQKIDTTAALKANGAFIAIVVKDADACAQWYEQNLGLKEIKRGKSPKGNAGNIVLGGERFYIELIYFINAQAKTAERGADGSIPQGINKAGAVLDRPTFDALYERLKARGASFLGGRFGDKEMKLESFIVRDNEDNLIQFFAPIS